MRAFITKLFAATFFLGIALSSSAINTRLSKAFEDDPFPTLERGAFTYNARCSLCHGTDARGGGILAQTISGYPRSDLIAPKFAIDTERIRQVIAQGGNERNGLSHFMPPWGSELSWTDLESLIIFLDYIRKNNDVSGLIQKATLAYPPSTSAGRNVFLNHCSQCHGKEGRGDGRLSMIIKNPPPYNLTKSRAPDDYLAMIIKSGGKSMGRSPQMPPWQDELSESDIQSVILYLKDLRVRP